MVVVEGRCEGGVSRGREVWEDGRKMCGARGRKEGVVGMGGGWSLRKEDRGGGRRCEGVGEV